MSRKIFKYSIVFYGLMGYSILCAAPQESPVEGDDFSAAFSSIKNPFSSPVSVKKVVPVVEKKKDVAPKPVVVAPPPEPVVVVVANPPALRITGLVWNSDKPQAIINGKILGLGNEVDGSKLIAVRQNEVDVIYAGRQFTINANQPVKNESKKSR